MLLLALSLLLASCQTLATADLPHNKKMLQRQGLNTNKLSQSDFEEALDDPADPSAAFSSIVAFVTQTDAGTIVRAWETTAASVSSNHKAEYTSFRTGIASLQGVPIKTAGPAVPSTTFTPSAADGAYDGPQLGVGPIVGIVFAAVLAVVVIAVACCCPCCGCCVARRDEERGQSESVGIRSQYIDAVTARRFKMSDHRPATSNGDDLSSENTHVVDTTRSKPPSYSEAVSEDAVLSGPQADGSKSVVNERKIMPV